MFFSQPLHFVTHTLTNLMPLMPYTPSLGSNGPYNSVLRIHFTTRVASMTVRREHNNGAPKFWIDTDGKTENTTLLSPARKEWLWYHKRGRDTALEVEAQIYSDYITWNNASKSNASECKSYKTSQVGSRASQVGGITCIVKVNERNLELSGMAVIRPR